LRRIGITGHQGLGRATAALVAGALHEKLEQLGGPALGITSLAEGADQLFAEAVLESGGSIFAVIPAAGYERSFEDPSALRRYHALRERAGQALELDYREPGEKAYWAAGQKVVELCDQLFAVWDGQPAGGLGGTADVVAFAREQGKTVTVIWPAGASRDAAGDG
jgi:hypothetical protein